MKNLLTFEEFLNESSINEQNYVVHDLRLKGREIMKEMKKGTTIEGLFYTLDGRDSGNYRTVLTVTKLVDVKSSKIFGIYEVEVTSTKPNKSIKPNQTLYLKFSTPVPRGVSFGNYEIIGRLLEEPTGDWEGSYGFNIEKVEI
jgi:hypothetical protein